MFVLTMVTSTFYLGKYRVFRNRTVAVCIFSHKLIEFFVVNPILSDLAILCRLIRVIKLS